MKKNYLILMATIVLYIVAELLCTSTVLSSDIPEHPECSEVEGDFWGEILVNINPESSHLEEDIMVVSYNLWLEEIDPEKILFFSRIASGEYSKEELREAINTHCCFPFLGTDPLDG